MQTTEATETAQTIINQTGNFAMITVGADNFDTTPKGNGLAFTLNVRAMTENGTRESTPRTMNAVVTLDITDLYDVEVTYDNGTETATHFKVNGVTADKLEPIMLGLENGTLTGDHGTRLAL